MTALASTASPTPTSSNAWENALRIVPHEYDYETRLLVLGPARDGASIELVVVEADHPTASSTPTG